MKTRAAAADALAAVEDGVPLVTSDRQRDDQRDRERDDEEERREHDVERAEDRVARAGRRLERELPVAADERVLEPRRLRHAPDRKAASACGEARRL